MADVWPELAAELEAGLRAQGDDNLAATVPTIRIGGFCGCREVNCLTFSSRSAPVQDAERGSIVVEELPGLVVVDIGGGHEIVQVEILDWGAMRPSYLRMRKRVKRSRWKP